MKKKALITGAVLVAAWLALLLGGGRVLVQETKVEPGATFVVEGCGDVGASDHTSLVCRYFTGRSVVTSVYWYAPNGVMGKDECPILVASRTA